MHSDFDADDLRIISYIASGLNMSLVAKKLGCTPQRISQRINQMEKICKTSLVYHKGGIHLTQAGQHLLTLAQNVEKEVIHFKKNLAALKSDDGQLRIIAISSLLQDDAPIALDKALKEYPNLRINLKHGTADQIIKAIEMGTADIGLIGLTRQIEGLVFTPYKREQLCILTALDHPLSQFDETTFKEVTQYPFIDTDSDNLMNSLLNAAEIYSRIILERRMKVSCLEIAARYACLGYGVTMTLDSVAQRYANRGEGKKIRLTDIWASIDIAVCTKRMSRQTPAINYFLSELEKNFKPDRQS